MSYRAKSRTSYGNQMRRKSNSFGYGNKNCNKLDNPTLLSNHTIEPIDSSDYEFVSHVDFPVIIKGKLTLSRNPWAIELENIEQLKPEQLIALCKQPIEIILCDPLTKQPLRTFKVQKIADIKKENLSEEADQEQSKPMLPESLSSLSHSLEMFGYCISGVEK